MRIHLIVSREGAGPGDSPWVAGAWDENTIDENESGYFEDISKPDRRVVILNVPDDTLERPWDYPQVDATVEASS